MAQSVVIKKKEKVNRILAELGTACTFEAFSVKFKEYYPEDWKRINQRYNQHEKMDSKGKGHPMPNPDRYMQNMYNVGMKEFNKK